MISFCTVGDIFLPLGWMGIFLLLKRDFFKRIFLYEDNFLRNYLFFKTESFREKIFKAQINKAFLMKISTLFYR